MCWLTLQNKLKLVLMKASDQRDFKKGLYLINHNVLLSKMEAAGIKGVALNWF